MDLTVQIPDDVARRLNESGGDLSRRALEALAAEEYKRGHLTRPDLQRLLGLETSYQIDVFLKVHDASLQGSLEDDAPEGGSADTSIEGNGSLAAEATEGTQFEKEHGIWVYRTGEPMPASLVDATLDAIRREREILPGHIPG